MAGFSEQLRAEAEPIWRAIFRHPFLREIKDGTLPLETFRYYLGQDYHYLEGFGRAVAMTLAKAPDAALLQELAHRVMTPVERPLHHQLIEAAGLTMASPCKAPCSGSRAAASGSRTLLRWRESGTRGQDARGGRAAAQAGSRWEAAALGGVEAVKAGRRASTFLSASGAGLAPPRMRRSSRGGMPK